MAEAASSNVQSRRRALVLATAFGALAGVALWQRLDLGFRGPSLDETSGLYVARLLRQGVAWSTYAYATSSQIPMHLFGVGEQLGGLWGARVLSALLSACSLGFFFGGMRALFGSTSVAAWAALLLALQAPHLFTGKLATSDVVALCFFTGSMWLLIEGLRGRHLGWLCCALASVSFAAAVLSRYLVLAHAPILLGLVAVRRPRLLLAALAPCTLLLADYLHRHWMELQMLAHHQLALLASSADSRLAILHDTATYVAPMLALALASLAMQVWRAGARWRAIRLHVFLLSLAVPLIGLHVAFATRDQLPLHLVYPLVALTPLAAWFLHRISRRSLALSLGAAAVLAVLGLAQTRQLERSFPELTPVVEHLRTHLGPTTTVLSEEGYLLRFAFPQLPARNFSELTWLDNDGDGRRTAQDVIDAVWDGKPDYVLTTGQIAPTLVEKLRTSVLPHRYRKVLEQPYALSDALTRHPRGAVELWKRSGVYQGPAAR
jgi:hypothetical protein